MLSNNLRVIALIPARGGSKGLVGKNMFPVNGKPLLQYTVEAAINSRVIDDIWISSDDLEILNFSSKFSRVNILRRPEAIADDVSSAIDVVKHFISCMPPHSRHENPLLVYLQPTSPLRSAGHIDHSLEAMDANGHLRLMSVCILDKSAYKSFRLDKDGLLLSLFEERLSNSRRQDLPVTLYPNGAIYAFTVEDFLLHGSFPSNGSYPYVMNENDSVDIDSIKDVYATERLLGGVNGAI